MKNGEILEVTVKEIKDNTVIGLVDEQNVYVRAKDISLLEPEKKYFGFLYLNRHGEWCVDTTIPKASLKSFGWGKVETVDHSSGVFVSIGLADKDILVSLDDLPDNSRDWPQVDDELIVRLERDNKDRLWGKLATDEDLISGGFISFDHKFKQNEMVSGHVYHLGKTGVFILLKEGRFAYLHHTEMEENVHLGQEITGRIIGFGAHDRINISLLKNAYARIDDDAAMILAAIKFTPDKKLLLSDSSTPKEIKDKFGISKSSFKRAVGHLLKQNLITSENGYLKIKS
ncbi:RNA-binding protein [Xylocopilactobacillus apis]|uniref:RNA-binding protein n=1 Tax=Xylocopilactobacillus apis TaxID=2932183 RepID=A0AAU9CRJ2_9LACO|nr:RNA-binding protein [Xylocopilactobacillus apis]BDR56549.1 RNA-binding protein [Xylocopilactobacillus apis]